ncbi:MAG: cell division protein DivIC [Flavobacteriaceae bacterium]|jgi:cell division protein DivIC|tara:strand:+ start:1213 stop:1539 length:327 start_codon:yes stop_codon:yes gene_type:complete
MRTIGSYWSVLKAIKKNYFLYGGILLFFISWMLFLDTHSWTIHAELNNEIETLELEQEALIKVVKADIYNIDQFQNQDSLERFARERYGHKKENETIFIIEVSDILPR